MSKIQTLAVEVKELKVLYGAYAQALQGVNLSVPVGSVVTLLGANGAGKTTLIRAISGLLGFHSGSIPEGQISLFEKPTTGLSAQAIVRLGVAQVPEGRGILAELSVEDNLKVGAISVPGLSHIAKKLEEAYEMFPVLGERQKVPAGYLSGGEQQMLALGRALMSSPRLIILDEPSLGLAPVIVLQLKEIIKRINESGTTVLLVEQNVAMALDISDYGYVLERGSVAKEGKAADLAADSEVRDLYLGVKG